MYITLCCRCVIIDRQCVTMITWIRYVGVGLNLITLIIGDLNTQCRFVVLRRISGAGQILYHILWSGGGRHVTYSTMQCTCTIDRA